MKIKVTAFPPRNQLSMVLASVHFWDEEATLHNAARVEVFIQQSDSVAELRRQAIIGAQDFLLTCAKASREEAQD